MTVIVFPGDELTLASDLLPRSAFISELFPTFDRPEKTICGFLPSGNCAARPAVTAREEFCMFIFISALSVYLTIAAFST